MKTDNNKIEFDNKKIKNSNTKGIIAEKEAFALLEKMFRKTDFNNPDEYEKYQQFGNCLSRYIISEKEGEKA